MDPLSITASVVAIGQLVSTACNAFVDLRKLCKTLPGRWTVLNNEVSDLQLVILEVSKAIAQQDNLHEQEGDIVSILNRSRRVIKDIINLVRKFSSLSEQKRAPLFQAYAWRRDQPRPPTRTSHIRVDVATLSVNLHDLAARIDTVNNAELKNDFVSILDDTWSAGMIELKQALDSHTEQVKQAMEINTERVLARQEFQVGHAYELRRRSPPRPIKIDRSPPPPYDQGSVEPNSIRVASHNPCRPGCICVCHQQTKKSSRILDRVFGQLFIGYSGLPMLNSKCDVSSCERAQKATASVEYWFPPAFVWSQIIRFQVTYRANIGPQFEIKSLRRVPDSAQCVSYAMDGNIDGLKDLFRRGLASPRDVSSTRGYSLIRWAVYAKKWQTCKFLTYAGADPDYRPILDIDNHARNKASQELMMARDVSLTEEAVEALMVVTGGTEDFIDEQNYTILHRIVLGLSFRDLHEAIFENSDLLNTCDAMGRTPLAWAACRRD